MAPTAIRERRRTLRYRNLLVRQMVQMKNKVGMLLMEAGVSYNKQKLHKAGYFRELLASNPDINPGLRSLLCQCREMVVRLGKMEAALIRSLKQDRLLTERVQRLMSIPAVGQYDREDARLLLRLMRENNFPRIWVPSPENRDLRQLLWHRHRLVQMRTRIMNQLQALAMNEGYRWKKKLFSEKGRA